MGQRMGRETDCLSSILNNINIKYPIQFPALSATIVFRACAQRCVRRHALGPYHRLRAPGADVAVGQVAARKTETASDGAITALERAWFRGEQPRGTAPGMPAVRLGDLGAEDMSIAPGFCDRQSSPPPLALHGQRPSRRMRPWPCASDPFPPKSRKTKARCLPKSARWKAGSPMQAGSASSTPGGA